VCALSDFLEVETGDGTLTHHQSFARGRVLTPLVAVPRPDRGSGTVVRFHPDPDIFGTQTFPVGKLEAELSTLAALVPGVRVNLVVDQTYGPWMDLGHLHQATWPHQPDGPTFLIEHEAAAGRASLALSFSSHGGQRDLTSRSFCNYFETSEGGSHVAGLEAGLRRVFGPSTLHVLQRTYVIVHVTLEDAQFVGPTRGKLDSAEAISLVADALALHLPALLAEHPELDAGLRPFGGEASD